VKIIRPSYSSYGLLEPEGMLLYYYFSNSIIRHFFWGRLSSLLNLRRVRPQDKILEIGFGPGIVFPSLANLCNLVIGIDIFDLCNFETVKNMCKSEKIEEKVELLRGDAQNISLRQETCDIAIAMDVLEHIPDLSRSMKEIERILKRDGSFLACIPMENFYRRTARRLFDLPPLHEDEHFYKEILDSIESSFRITKMKLYPSILPVCILLSAKKKN
jgi:ubiquinone/menaquinone biosynthesis C-methylase UbiE